MTGADTRLHSDEAKPEIFKRYADWVAKSLKRRTSPRQAKHDEYGFSTRHPERLYDNVRLCGSVKNQPGGERPPQYSQVLWGHMTAVIRVHRELYEERPSASDIRKGMRTRGAT